MDEINALRDVLAAGRRMVFFGGAGVSTESGIPDFRSASGLYRREESAYSPEEMLHHDFFMQYQPQFYEYYFNNLVHPAAQPNDAHRVLASLEAAGNLAAVVTQNVDGLHQQAGSRTVAELHGSVRRNYCMNCGAFHSLEEMLSQRPTVPVCRECGSVVKPDVVLYGETLHDETVCEAIGHIRQADVLIIGGTSLSVYPAAGLIEYFNGDTLVLINRDATTYDRAAQLIIRGKIGETLQKAWSKAYS